MSPVRRQQSEDPDDSALGIAPRLDAWLKSTAQARPRSAQPREGDDLDIHPRSARDIPAAESSPARRDVADAATRTATTLGSLASWVEQAERELAETTAAAARAQKEAAASVESVVTAFSQRIEAVERKLKRAGREPAAATPRPAATVEPTPPPSLRPAPPLGDEAAFESALQRVERRIDELGDKIATAPRPIGRRGLDLAGEVRSAVSEIRGHQVALEAGPSASAQRPVLPALGALTRSQTAILTTLKMDVSALAGRVDATGQGLRTESEALRGEIAGLRGSADKAATRDDLGRLERNIEALTSDIAALRMATERSPVAGDLEALQIEIRRLADAQPAAEPGPSAQALDLLSRKLDIVAASGVDPSVVDALSRQVDDVRLLLTNAAAPQALSLVESHLSDLSREVADIGQRQVDPSEFASLKSTVDEIKTTLAIARPEPAPHPDVARVVREAGEPIETMLGTLAEKLDRLERQVSDPDTLDQLERQIQDLVTRFGETPQRDPAIASLERSVTGLLSEVASWRDTALETAEEVARAAVAEALSATAPNDASIELHLAEMADRYAAAEERTRDSLAAVHGTLVDVTRRIASIEADAPRAASARPRVETRAPAATPVGPDARQRFDPPMRGKTATLDEAFASSHDDEILLEPGAGRPTGGHIAASQDASAPDTVDVRSSFIAAARRAAQAAAAETASPPKAQPRETSGANRAASSPGEIMRRLREMVTARRRPLLLGAAAIVLALGTLQVVRTSVGDPSLPRQTSNDVRPAPAAATPSREIGDPVTTQSIGAKPTSRSEEADRVMASPVPPPGPGPSPGATAARPDVSVGEREPPNASGVAVAPVAPAPMMARLPPGTDVAAMPVGLKSAALAGNPSAMHELAARTADGRGVVRDAKAAAALFEKAAEKGLAPAQYRTGNGYERGAGVTRDLELAKSWYRRAAEAGNVRAMHNLAVLLADGSGAKPDYAAAAGWFAKAAEHGVRDSQFNLAVLYARGLGTTQDLAKSYQWLAIAAGQGDQDAGRKRDDVAGRLPAADLARAKAMVERWRPAPADTAANEVQIPDSGWPEVPARRPAKTAARI